MSNAPFSVKQGEPLQITMQLTQDDGTPMNIAGAVIFAEIRDVLGNLIATPEIEVTEAAQGMFTFRTISDPTWPVGRVRTDIAVSFGGVSFITETAFIQVSQPVTIIGDQFA